MSNLHPSFIAKLPHEMYGIYAITNSLNGRRYVGSSKNIRGRRYGHRHDLVRNIHYNTHLQNAWNFYGPTVFRFEILEAFRSASTTDLLYIEQEYIDATPNLYNLNLIAGKPPDCTGLKHRPETIEKRRNSLKGKYLGRIPWNKGKRFSEEELTTIRKRYRETPLTQKQIDAQARNRAHKQALKGIKKDPTIVAKTAASLRGVPQKREYVERRRASLLGKKRTIEQTKANSARGRRAENNANLQRFISPTKWKKVSGIALYADGYLVALSLGFIDKESNLHYFRLPSVNKIKDKLRLLVVPCYCLRCCGIKVKKLPPWKKICPIILPHHKSVSV